MNHKICGYFRLLIKVGRLNHWLCFVLCPSDSQQHLEPHLLQDVKGAVSQIMCMWLPTYLLYQPSCQSKLKSIFFFLFFLSFHQECMCTEYPLEGNGVSKQAFDLWWHIASTGWDKTLKMGQRPKNRSDSETWGSSSLSIALLIRVGLYNIIMQLWNYAMIHLTTPLVPCRELQQHVFHHSTQMPHIGLHLKNISFV